MLKAIMFDAGDILIIKREEEFQKFRERVNPDEKIPIDQVNAILSQLWNLLANSPNEEGFQQIIHSQNFPQITSDEIRELEINAYWKNPHPDAVKLLQFVKKEGFRIGIVTDSVNTNERLRVLLNEEQLGKYIDVILSSSDCGCQKPDSRIYEAMLTKLSVEAHEALFVGHDYDELQGALDCGIQIIEYSQKSTHLTKNHTKELLGVRQLLLSLANDENKITYLKSKRK